MKKCILYLVCSMLICVFCGCGTDPDILLKGDRLSVESETENISSNGDGSTHETEPDVIYVYICGAVKNPGVYEMQPGSRIYQLVELAGGMKKKADTKSVNLAETVSDGQMVQIPEQAEDTDTGENSAAETSDIQSSGISSDGKVNINTASAEQLMTLTGIGEAKAEQIIAYREQNGSFASIEDIMLVSGIKEGTFAKIEDNITVQ